MTPANALMKELLAENGIKATPKYISDGSLKRSWRLYEKNTNWWDNTELWAKLTAIGFVDFDGKPLSKLSGNGGVFSIFARYKGSNENLLQPMVYNANNAK